MRRLMLVAVLVVVAGVGVVSASPAGRLSGVGAGVHSGGGEGSVAFWTRGVIDRLAADGRRVAASTRAINGACDRIVVWRAPGKKFVTFDTHLHCPQGGSPAFEHVTEVALGAGKVAWIEASGGNNQELYLYAASVLGGPSKTLDSGYNGMGEKGDIAGSYVGALFGAGPLLAYNSWSECSWFYSDGEPTDDCPVEGQVSGETLKWLSAGDRVRIKSGPRSFRLRVVGGGHMALDSLWADSGVVIVLTSTGALSATVPAAAGNDPPRALALTATRLVIERRRTLDVYNPSSGALIRTIPLGVAQRLQLDGANANLAVLSGLHRLVAVRLSDGKQATIPLPDEARATTSPISPRLSDAGLFYAYNVTSTPAKGRIIYIPISQLLARLGSSG
jgi:hypothetical protein